MAAIQIKRLSLSEGIEPFNGHAFDAKSPASNGLEACPATVAFYEDPDQQVEPSVQVVVAVDAWARELARNSLTSPTPTLFCTPDGQCTPAVELRLSRDLVPDPSGHPSVGRPESAALWLRENPDMDAIDGRLAHRLFLAICQFPAMRASWLREVLGGSAGEITRHLGRFAQTAAVMFLASPPPAPCQRTLTGCSPSNNRRQPRSCTLWYPSSPRPAPTSG